MKIQELIYQKTDTQTGNKSVSENPDPDVIGDLLASRILFYDNSPDWTFVSDINGVKKYESATHVCELSVI